MNAGAAVVGAVAGAYNTPGAAADGYARNRNAVESAVNAYSSKFEQSLSKGHSPIIAGMSALGGTLWGAYQETRNGSRSNQPAWENAMSAVAPQAPDPNRTTTIPVNEQQKSGFDSLNNPNL
jgi:hypothetical protein